MDDIVAKTFCDSSNDKVNIFCTLETFDNRCSP